MIREIKQKNSPQVNVGLVVRKEGKVLLGKRKSVGSAENWIFPGRHLNYGEKIEECALSGLEEETGLKGTSLSLGPWTNDLFAEEEHSVTLFVFIDLFEGELQTKQPHKCEEWKWFDWNDLPIPLLPSIRSLIQTIGMEKLKQASHFPFSSLQNVTYPAALEKPHCLFVTHLTQKRVEGVNERF